eukprot:TRINITY_DN128807_c0_g1_i1.p3 TRINITY_DN128807_c0_g1~~TRINITY_DN128807_c0_g1_i1.p3  ORF type:complete len:159 (-),score=6.73 TRINITY_DN128807_c0_g1_i1:73-549(-)
MKDKYKQPSYINLKHQCILIQPQKEVPKVLNLMNNLRKAKKYLRKGGDRVIVLYEKSIDAGHCLGYKNGKLQDAEDAQSFEVDKVAIVNELVMVKLIGPKKKQVRTRQLRRSKFELLPKSYPIHKKLDLGKRSTSKNMKEANDAKQFAQLSTFYWGQD